uniref:Cardiomyopathy associated 5 n=1 Tax=Astatotilapia calliptera TaxID=8154 RepID=A0A3P8NL69_ASTCA
GEITKMDECESLYSEMTELQEFQCEASDVMSQDDEDELEELQNSLREVVQDPSVKPKLQCLMVDPSFSMVTVQSEDSGIVWETASSRCSTPWASETSSTSEAYSMEGSGAAGKITIVFDEEKVVRRRTRSGGRSSRLGDRLSRPGSSRSASALGVERPEMAEVSLPNVKQENSKTETDLEEIKSKDQQLFSLISEGYEILNIRVPSKLPTVDEEESTELQDNLSYLDQTPKIKSHNHIEWTLQHNQVLPEGEEILEHQEVLFYSSQPSADTERGHTPTQRESTGDIDYFEKFTLLDVVASGEQAELQEEFKQPAAKLQAEEQKPAGETATGAPSASEDSFVFVSDVDIVGEHLDEVFYGEGLPADALHQREEDKTESQGGMRSRRESQRSTKGSGSVLFESEETTLTPIFISPGPPKIIDPILLEEPTAMSFMYSDLYEDAVGERRKSDEEYSEAESVASEKSYRRRLSDSEEAHGYLEKFILKDESPTLDVQPEPVASESEGRMMWPQSTFEMTGCLIRVPEEEKKEKVKKEEPEVQEVQLSEATQEETIGVTSEDSGQESKPPEKKMEDQQMKLEDKTDKTESSECSSEKPLPETHQADCKVDHTQQSEGHQREEEKKCEQSCTEPEHACEEVLEKTDEKTPVVRADIEEPVSSEVPPAVNISEVQAEAWKTSLPEEVVSDTKIESADEELVTKAEDLAEVKEPETVTQETFTLTEPSAQTPASQHKEAEDVGPVEVITDCDAAVHTVVEVTEKAVNEKEIQTQVCVDLQEVRSIPEGHEPLTGETTAEDKLDKEGLEVTATSIEVTKPVSEPVMTDADEKLHLILLVPKGEAVEMDVEISQWSEKDTVPLPESNSTAELQALVEETMMEPEVKVEPETSAEEKEQTRNDFEMDYSPPAPVEEADSKEAKIQRPIEEDKIIFTPQQDSYEVHREEIHPEQTVVEQMAEIHEMEETSVIKADLVPHVDLHKEDVEQQMEQDWGLAECPDVPDVEMEYEVISKQDAKEMTEPETQRDVAGLLPQPTLKKEEDEEMAQLAAELQGMDWFCLTCGFLMSEKDCMSGEHHSHDVTAVDTSLSGWISELQERSENIEDLVSELELAYNSVEVNEAAMKAQNKEMMDVVMEQYNNMSVSMEEEKKTKLEQLYDQIVSFQESIDSAKAILETASREAETEASVSPEAPRTFMQASTMELGPKGLLVFEDYAKANTSSSNLAQRKGIPVPQRPTLLPQEPGSATSTSVTVYWKVNPGDIIDCFQVYCMEDPQGAVSEEYRVTVKESYCVLEDLESDKMYKVWVMAVNYTGCSLPSERLTFRTAPSVPVIDTERCSILWDSATLRWSSAERAPGQSYTLEYCRQYELEGEGLRSISGIKTCEQKILLQPSENYLFYIKAVNEAGASEQSEAALISTKGTRFHLLKASAHPALQLSENQTTLHYSQDAHKTASLTDTQCPSILGELLPARGIYYWETSVSQSTAYRLGVAYSTANRNSSLGENSLSWCLQCTPSPSGFRYQLLHNDIQSSVFVTETPDRVGTLLDYQLGRLSFYNAQSGQLLGTFRQNFTQPCQPALALELPGSLELSMVPVVPEFTKDS